MGTGEHEACRDSSCAERDREVDDARPDPTAGRQPYSRKYHGIGALTAIEGSMHRRTFIQASAAALMLTPRAASARDLPDGENGNGAATGLGGRPMCSSP